MPVIKGVSLMSLTTWTARSTKYQRYLNISNVFMLVLAVFLITTASILIRFYHLSKLDFLSWLFSACPWCMLAHGCFTFIISIYGFLISNQESRYLLFLRMSTICNFFADFLYPSVQFYVVWRCSFSCFLSSQLLSWELGFEAIRSWQSMLWCIRSVYYGRKPNTWIYNLLFRICCFMVKMMM